MAQQTVTQIAAVPRVNLLPPEIAEAQRLRQAQALMGVVVLAALVVVAGLYFLAGQRVNNAKDELAVEQARNTELRAKRAALQPVADLQAQVDGAEALLIQAMGQEIRWTRYLNDLALRIPDNVWLLNLTAATTGAAPAPNPLAVPGIGTLNFTGVGFDHPDLAVWLETLAREQGFANAFFSSSVRSLIGERRVINFATTVNLTEAALSGRFTKPAGV